MSWLFRRGTSGAATVVGGDGQAPGGDPSDQPGSSAGSKQSRRLGPGEPARRRTSRAGQDHSGRSSRAGTETSDDREPPSVSAVVLRGKKNRKGEFGPRVRLKLVAEDSGSGVRAILWRPNSGPWRPYAGPIELHRWWQAGSRTVEFYAVDLAANRSAISRFDFIIDDVPPEFPPLRVGRFATGGQPGTFVGNEGIFIPPFDSDAVLEYRFDREPFRPCQAGQTIRPTSDGVFTITFRIRDEVGNTRTRQFRIKSDSTPPRTTIRYE